MIMVIKNKVNFMNNTVVMGKKRIIIIINNNSNKIVIIILIICMHRLPGQLSLAIPPWVGAMSRLPANAGT